MPARLAPAPAAATRTNDFKNSTLRVRSCADYPVAMTVARDLVSVSCSLVAVLLGLLLALPLHDVIVGKIYDGVSAYGVLSSPAAGGYAGWVDNRDPSSSTITLRFSLYNLTNPAAVLAGAKPDVQAVGPLIYNYINTKHNVTWEADGDEAVFFQYQRFVAACVLGARGGAGGSGARTLPRPPPPLPHPQRRRDARARVDADHDAQHAAHGRAAAGDF